MDRLLFGPGAPFPRQTPHSSSRYGERHHPPRSPNQGIRKRRGSDVRKTVARGGRLRQGTVQQHSLH